MKKLWVFGTSHTAGGCDDGYIKNCYTKIIHDNTNYIVKNLAKTGISFETQIRYIYYFLEHLQEKPDSILIEVRAFSAVALGYMPNDVLHGMYSYLKMIINRFEDNINNNEYANIQPLFSDTPTRENVFFSGLTTRNNDKHKDEWYKNFKQDNMEVYIEVHDEMVRLNYMFMEQRILSLYGLLLTIKNLNITPYWFIIDSLSYPWQEKEVLLGSSPNLIKDQLGSMYVGYSKNNKWLSFLDKIKLDDGLLCADCHPNEQGHEMIANDLISQLC